MRRLAILLALVAASAASAADGPAPARRAELLHLVRQDCGSCHGLTLKGGLGPSLEPAALVEKATLPGQRVIEGTLRTLPALATQAAVKPPALLIVGEVVRLRSRLAWFVSTERELAAETA